MRSGTYLLTTVASLIACPALSQTQPEGEQSPAPAQEQPEAREGDIIVTAQRRAELAKDVPVSITTFSGADIQQNNIRDIGDYVRRTPNVSFTQNIGSRQAATIGIRGVSNLGGLSDAFTIYLDEFAGDAINPNIYDVERVEVLRGPQGTYFGRNSTGGALNITTRKPDDTLAGEIEVGAERFDTYLLRGFVNVPLGSTLAVRATGEYERGDGAVRNVYPGGVQGDIENLSLRLQARWQPIEALTIDVQGIYDKETSGLLQAVPTGVTDEFTASLLGFLPLVAGKAQFLGIRDPFAAITPDRLPINDAGGFYPRNQSRVNINGPESASNERYTLIGKIAYDFGTFGLYSVSGYQDTDRSFARDVDGTAFDYSFARETGATKLFTQEVRIASIGDDAFKWTLGGYYLNRKDSSITTTEITQAGLPFIGSDIFSRQTSTTRTESFAGFADASYAITPELKVTLGARYTHEKVRNVATDQQLNLFILGQPGGILQFLTQGFTLQPAVTLPAASARFDNFSPRVAVNYDLTTDLTAYGVVSRGFKSGGPQTNANAIAAGFTSFRPEKLTNYELGLKGRLVNGAVSFALAAFMMDWKDLQVSVEQPTASGSFITVQNAASARSKGAEFEASWRTPLRGLKLDGGIGYLDAKFRRFPGAAFDPAIAATCRGIVGQQISPGAADCDLSGQRLPLAPKWTTNANAEYRTNLRASLEGFVRAEWQYRSGSTANLQSFALGGGAGLFPYYIRPFEVLNLRAGVETQRIAFSAYIENVIGKDYFTVARPAGYLNGLRVVPNPTLYGIRARVRL